MSVRVERALQAHWVTLGFVAPYVWPPEPTTDTVWTEEQGSEIDGPGAEMYTVQATYLAMFYVQPIGQGDAAQTKQRAKERRNDAIWSFQNDRTLSGAVDGIIALRAYPVVIGQAAGVDWWTFTIELTTLESQED